MRKRKYEQVLGCSMCMESICIAHTGMEYIGIAHGESETKLKKAHKHLL